MFFFGFCVDTGYSQCDTTLTILKIVSVVNRSIHQILVKSLKKNFVPILRLRLFECERPQKRMLTWPNSSEHELVAIVWIIMSDRVIYNGNDDLQWKKGHLQCNR